MRSLPVGQDVEACSDEASEQPRAEAAAVEHDGEAALADQGADLVQELRQHLDQAGVGLGGDDEQRVAARVVDPVVGGRRHRQAHARDVRLGDGSGAVIDAHVAVEVEKAHRLAAQGDATLGEAPAKLGGALRCGQARQLAP